MTGTIRKRDVNRLLRQIRKRSSFKNRGQHFWIRNTKFSYSEIKYALQNIQSRTIGVLIKAWNSLNRFHIWIARKMYKRLPKAMKNVVKKMGRIEAKMQKKIICLLPRLERRYGQMMYPEGISVKALKDKKYDFIKDLIEYVKNGNAEDEEVETIEDCFDDMEKPKFGWRVKIFAKENERCELDFENPEKSTCTLPSNVNDNKFDRVNSRYSSYHAQSRQTGEGFRSAAPPDCRIELCGLTPTDDNYDDSDDIDASDDYYADDYYDEIKRLWSSAPWRAL